MSVRSFVVGFAAGAATAAWLTKRAVLGERELSDQNVADDRCSECGEYESECDCSEFVARFGYRRGHDDLPLKPNWRWRCGGWTSVDSEGALWSEPES